MDETPDDGAAAPSRDAGTRRARPVPEVADELAALIDGEWARRKQLPPGRELAQRLGVSTATVWRAVVALEARGLVSRQGAPYPVLIAGRGARAASRRAPSAPAVADDLAALIGGEWARRQALPPGRELTQRFGVSAATVWRAVAALEARGLVFRQGSRYPVVIAGRGGRPASPAPSVQLAALVDAGEWGPGEALPSNDELAPLLGVSVRTAARAVAGLVELETLVRPPRGRPTVATGPSRVLSIAEVAERLTACIDCGVWPPGRRLPSQRELEQRFGVGRRTVQAALELLKERGKITRPGRGLMASVAGAEAVRVPSAAEAAAAQRLAELIVRRGWGPRHPLPPRKQLAQDFGVSPAMVARALAVLADRGLVTLEGKGHPTLVAGEEATDDPHA